MEKVLLSIVLASGLCAVSSHAGRTYHYVELEKTWTEAQSYCREHYTDLATVDNMEDMNILINMIPTRHSVWIGLHRTDMYSWMWSLTNSSFYKHGEMEFRKWSPGEPNNEYNKEDCGSMWDDGLWYDVPCSELYQAVCYYVGGSNVEHYILTGNMSWTEAQSYCRENYTDLVSVRNNAENEKVKGLVPPGTKVWIGLFRDSWKWTDGSNSSFRFWDKGEPNNNAGPEDCVTINFPYNSEKWADYPCNYRFHFICYNLTEGKEDMGCEVNGISYQEGQSFKPSCDMYCHCRGGGVSCVPACPLTFRLPTPDCPSPQLIRLPGKCCREWVCENLENSVIQDAITELAPEAPVMTRQVFKLRLNIEDSQDLDDEAMKEALLKEVKQKLKDQGLGHVKVSFRKQADGKFFTKEEKKDEL